MDDGCCVIRDTSIHRAYTTVLQSHVFVEMPAQAQALPRIARIFVENIRDWVENVKSSKRRTCELLYRVSFAFIALLL